MLGENREFRSEAGILGDGPCMVKGWTKAGGFPFNPCIVSVPFPTLYRPQSRPPLVSSPLSRRGSSGRLRNFPTSSLSHIDLICYARAFQINYKSTFFIFLWPKGFDYYFASQTTIL